MKKRYFLLFFIVVLMVSFMNMSAFAQDTRDITPVLSDDCISELYVVPGTKQNDKIMLAQNRQPISNEKEPVDELDDDFFDEDFDDTKQI